MLPIQSNLTISSILHAYCICWVAYFRNLCMCRQLLSYRFWHITDETFHLLLYETFHKWVYIAYLITDKIAGYISSLWKTNLTVNQSCGLGLDDLALSVIQVTICVTFHLTGTCKKGLVQCQWLHYIGTLILFHESEHYLLDIMSTSQIPTDNSHLDNFPQIPSPTIPNKDIFYPPDPKINSNPVGERSVRPRWNSLGWEMSMEGVWSWRH